VRRDITRIGAVSNSSRRALAAAAHTGASGPSETISACSGDTTRSTIQPIERGEQAHAVARSELDLHRGARTRRQGGRLHPGLAEFISRNGILKVDLMAQRAAVDSKGLTYQKVVASEAAPPSTSRMQDRVAMIRHRAKEDYCRPGR
jgi:hypothetical protein